MNDKYRSTTTRFYSLLIQDNPGEPVLSQTRDLLEQPLDFYEPDVLPVAQRVVSKRYRKPSNQIKSKYNETKTTV